MNQPGVEPKAVTTLPAGRQVTRRMDDDSDSAYGLYMNYLHVGNLIVVPQFGEGHKDQKAFDRMKDVMGNQCQVIKYDAGKIAENGGVLNCATWTVGNGIHS